jgi:hypothetical protein
MKYIAQNLKPIALILLSGLIGACFGSFLIGCGVGLAITCIATLLS